MRKSKIEKESELREAQNIQDSMTAVAENTKEFSFEDFEFKSIKDFEVYNREVRKFNRKCLHDRNKMRVKVPDESFHKKLKIKFQRFDQPENVLKAKVRNKNIDWEGQLKPGGTYWLPKPVIKPLNDLSAPTYAEVKVDDGGETKTETRQVGEKPRFSCQIVDFGNDEDEE